MLWTVVRRVYTRPLYILVATTTALLTLSVMLLLPNASLLLSVWSSAAVSFSTKLTFFVALYGSLATNFTLLTAGYTVMIAVLFGINISLLWFYITKAKRASQPDRSLTLAGFGGFVSGIFGIGCAACGTIILTAVAKLLGITWLLTVLPLHGAEFGILGVLLLSYSAYTLAKRINDPLLCFV